MFGDRLQRRTVWMTGAVLAAGVPLFLGGCGRGGEPAAVDTAAVSSEPAQGMPNGGQSATAGETTAAGASVGQQPPQSPNVTSNLPEAGIAPAAAPLASGDNSGQPADAPLAGGPSPGVPATPGVRPADGYPADGPPLPESGAGLPEAGVAAAATTSGEKLSTGEWLTGMATAMFAPGPQPMAGGPAGAMGPGGTLGPGGAVGPGGGLPEYGAAAEGPGGVPPGFPVPAGVEGGVGGVDGVPGTSVPTQQFDEGTAEHAVQQFVRKVQSGETTGLDKLINARTNDPLLAPLRDGTADAALLEKAKTLAAGATLAGIREGNSSKTFTVRNAAGQTLTITARQETNGEYRIASLRVEEPRGRRR